MRFSIAAGVAIALMTSSVGALVGGVSVAALNPPVAAAEYAARRATVAKAIGADAVFIAFSHEPARRSGDIDWPFRQDDNLLYLTGLNQEQTTLVLLPGEREHAEMIFALDRDPAREAWTGKILSTEDITAVTGVHEALSSRRFEQFIDALLQGRAFGPPAPSLYFAPPVAPSFVSAFRAGRAVAAAAADVEAIVQRRRR